MTYSCVDFTDSILDALNIKVPEELWDNPKEQAELAWAEIDRLKARAAAYEEAMQAVKRCASGEIERPLHERTPWPEAVQKLEAALKHVA